MIRIAKTWFGLDDKLSTCITADGIEYLREKLNEKTSYDVIVFDVNNDDSQSPIRCPHPSFLSQQVLLNVKSLLSTNAGLFILNFASRDDNNQQRTDCLKNLGDVFQCLSTVKVDDDINEIIFASENQLNHLKSSGKISQENLSFNFDITELLSKVKIEK